MLLAISAIVGSTVSIAGCGSGNPATVQIHGTIIYRGKPLQKAEVQFSPVGADSSKGLRRIASGEVDAQGVYSLSTFTKGDGVLPGDYAVTVTRIKRKSSIDGGDSAAKVAPFVPEVYSRQEATPLKASVPAEASGTLRFDFELKDQ
jgi:hypothetical protein